MKKYLLLLAWLTAVLTLQSQPDTSLPVTTGLTTNDLVLVERNGVRLGFWPQPGFVGLAESEISENFDITNNSFLNFDTDSDNGAGIFSRNGVLNINASNSSGFTFPTRTSNDGDIRISAAGKIVLESVDGIEIGGQLVSEKKYPVFRLQPPPRSSGDWTDFELKASRTNFGQGGATPEMVYYYHSPGSIAQEIGDEPDVWHTDSGHTDVREWRKLPSGTSIAANLTDANAVPGGIIVVVTDSAVEGSADDADLVWSLVWFDAGSLQTDASGRQIWRAVTPVRYVGQTFAP